jgi:XRE family transcriptional regulator, regulator of sulfur utilization
LVLAKAFGQVLRRRRKLAGLTQEQLGLDAGIERNYVSLLELGQHTPSLATLVAIAQTLGVEGSELVKETELLLAEAAVRPAHRSRSKQL